MIRRAAALLALCCLAGCADSEKVSEKISEGSLKIAVRNGSTAELAARGITVDGRLTCRTPPGNTLATVRIDCSGRAGDGRDITVEGLAVRADTDHPEQRYVIRVGGTEVLRKPCLDSGCKD